MTAGFNPYIGLRHSELCGRRKDYAKMIHAAVAARKVAERNLVLIAEALHDAPEAELYEASDHAVVRYLERVEGMDIGAVRELITMNCRQAEAVIGDKMRGQDGFLYCVNGDGFVTTVLPLGAVVDEVAENAAALQERPRKNGAQRRRLRGKRDFLASVDTRPEGGDATEIAAPFTGGAVPSEAQADAQRTAPMTNPIPSDIAELALSHTKGEDGSCDHEWVSGGEGSWPICQHCGERAPDDYGEPCYEDDHS